VARERGRDILPEIEGLVDLIFGLALSIGALILINTIPQNPGEIINDLLAFTYGFIILVFIWEEITKEMLLFKVETQGTLRVTYILLFLVALEPYLFNLITQHAESSIDELASMLYALDLGALMLILAFFAQKIVNGEGNVTPKVRRFYRYKRQSFMFTAAVFIISMVPIFWSISIGDWTKLRFVLWLIAPMMGLIMTVIRHLRGEEEGEPKAAEEEIA